MRRFKDRPKSIFSGSLYSNERLSYTEASIERKAQREILESEQESIIDEDQLKRKNNEGKHLWEIDKDKPLKKQQDKSDEDQLKRKNNEGKHLWEIDKDKPLKKQQDKSDEENALQDATKKKLIYALIAAICIVGYLIIR